MTGQWGDLANADVLLTLRLQQRRKTIPHPCAGSIAPAITARPSSSSTRVSPAATAVADIYCPIRPGTDIAFYGGMINYIFEHDRWQHEYCLNYTNLSYPDQP